MLDQLDCLLDQYEPIALEEINSQRLMNRVDTKFLLTSEQLARVLRQVQNHYRVLAINDVRLHCYHTVYFDTPDFAMYMRHHNGGANRYKVRIREYVESATHFLEVKFKNNKRRTVKQRIRLHHPIHALKGPAADFVAAHCEHEAGALEQKLWNSFQRITLVSTHSIERITVDVGLQYGWAERRRLLPHVVIAEVKQEKFSVWSDFVQALRAQGVHWKGFSKYWIGVADTYPYLKHNRFKPRLLQLDRLAKQSESCCE